MIYWQTYRAWLVNLLKERVYLSGKGFRPELKKSAKQLQTLIEANGYRNDRTLAGFLTRKRDEIEQLIPKNKAYESQLITLKAAIEEGQTHINPNY